MSIVYTGVNGGSFVNTITGPSPGDLVTAGSVGIIAQGAANLSKRLYDTKVERSGDTMTGALDVTAAAASGDVGVTATGDGVGSGLFGTGGATSGAGVEGVGGAPNGKGVYGEGSGSGVGGEFVGGATGGGVVATGGGAAAGGTFTGGATGKGVVCDSGSASVPALDVGVGNAIFTGTSTAATADPGFNDYLCGANVLKAFAKVELGAGTAALVAGSFGVASAVRTSTTVVRVTLVRAMADANYVPQLTKWDGGAAWPTLLSTVTTTTFDISWLDSAGVAIDISADTQNVSVSVYGRQ